LTECEFHVREVGEVGLVPTHLATIGILVFREGDAKCVLVTVQRDPHEPGLYPPSQVSFPDAGPGEDDFTLRSGVRA
jgi:hypothetical protein